MQFKSFWRCENESVWIWQALISERRLLEWNLEWAPFLPLFSSLLLSSPLFSSLLFSPPLSSSLLAKTCRCKRHKRSLQPSKGNVKRSCYEIWIFIPTGKRSQLLLNIVTPAESCQLSQSSLMQGHIPKTNIQDHRTISAFSSSADSRLHTPSASLKPWTWKTSKLVWHLHWFS